MNNTLFRAFPDDLLSKFEPVLYYQDPKNNED